MAEIATGNPYDAGSVGSGVGAVMFAPNHRDLSDINADWNRQNAQDEERALEAEKLKAQNAKALVQDLNLDTKGALDSDAAYLRGRINDITGRQAQLYQKHRGAPTSQDALIDMQHINADKNIFQSEVNQSAGHKEQLIKAIGALDADKAGENYDKDATALNIAKFRTASLPERQKMLDDGNGSLLVQQPPLLSKVTKEILAHPDKSTDGWEKTPIPNVYQQTTTKTHSPERIGELSRVSYADDRNVIKATNDAFGKLSPQEQERFKRISEQKQELEQRAGKDARVITPQESFLEDYLIQKNPKDVTTKVHNTQFNPFDLAAFRAKLKQEDQGESYMLQQSANVQNGISDVFDKEPVAKRNVIPVDPNNVGGAVNQAANTDNPSVGSTNVLNPDEYGIAPYFTGAKNGTADVRIPKLIDGKDAKGNQYSDEDKKRGKTQEKDANGHPVYTYSKVDNDVRRVIGVGQYDADGNRVSVEPLVADAKSLIAAGYAPDAPESEWKNDRSAYKSFDKGYAEALARNNGVKDERMSKFYKSVGGYDKRVTRISDSSDKSAKRISSVTPEKEKAGATIPKWQQAYDAFKAQFKRQPTDAELDKIKKKYGE